MTIINFGIRHHIFLHSEKAFLSFPPPPPARHCHSGFAGTSTLSIWLSVDPLADKYPSMSPYTYCANNPVRLVDEDGREISDGIFLDEFGNTIGNDGIDDGRRYVIKTRQKMFEGGVAGAGLSEEDYKETTDFIRNNSGNTVAFEKNRIAYDNSIEKESNKENIMEMKRIVRQDDGAGPLYGGKEKWNREYGGTNEDGVIIEQTKGPIGNPRTVGASIIITTSPKTKYSFHSHCSGWSFFNGTYSYYIQSPSDSDIRTACGTDYVFGRANRTVYIYNKQGVQATLPMKAF